MKLIYNVTALLTFCVIFYINCGSPKIDTYNDNFSDNNYLLKDKNDKQKESLHLQLVTSYLVDTFSNDTFINTLRNTIILRKESENSNYLANVDSIYIHLQGGFNQDKVLLKINNKIVINGVYTTSPIKGFAYLIKIPYTGKKATSLVELRINSEIIRQKINLKDYKSLLIKNYPNKEIVFIVTNKSQNYV